MTFFVHDKRLQLNVRLKVYIECIQNNQNIDFREIFASTLALFRRALHFFITVAVCFISYFLKLSGTNDFWS